MALSTPVALFIFNRPQLTQKVFAAIAAVQPQTLFIIADAPRSQEESAICEQTRAIAQQVDWDCQLKTHFAEENLGCKQRLSSGLNWVFEQVSEAIILEDDCLPHPSFFEFCQTLLTRYQDNEHIVHITGNNFLLNEYAIADQYYFTKYPHIWGWATWRRAWQKYDIGMKDWPDYKFSRAFRQQCGSFAEYRYWLNMLDCAYRNQINTWDYQWLYSCWRQQGVTIAPQHNLVSNLGFHAGHSHEQQSIHLAELSTQAIASTTIPLTIEINRAADRLAFKHCFGEPSARAFSPQALYESLYSRWLISRARLRHRLTQRSP